MKQNAALRLKEVPGLVRAAPFAILICLAGLGFSQAEETRVFTNASGAQIEAALVDVMDGAMVKIRRVSDGKEFSIPVASLSRPDQQFIASWHKAKTDPDYRQAGNTLVILADSVMDNLAPFSSRLSRENFQVGARTFRLVMPIGSWVCYQPEAFHAREFLIEYRGAKSWVLETKENEIWLTRDQESPELIGLNFPTQPREDEESTGAGSASEEIEVSEPEEEAQTIASIFEGIDGKRLGQPLSLALNGQETLEELDLIPDSVPIAINVRYPLTDERFANLGSKNVVAAHFAILDEKASRLELFENLKYLWVRAYGLGEGEVLELPAMPRLEHLVLVDLGGKIHWDKVLQGVPRLRSLLTMSYGRNSPGGGSPITTFAANPNLKVLALYQYSEIYLEAGALDGVDGLEWLWLDENVFTGGGASSGPGGGSTTRYIRTPSGRMAPVVRRGHGPGVEAFREMKNLKRLFLHLDKVNTQEFDEWAQTGALDGLRDFGGKIVPNAELLPRLESLELSIRTARELPDFGRLSSPQLKLKILEFNYLSNKDLKFLELANPETLVSFKSSQGLLEDPELLYRFSGLRNIELTSNKGKLVQLDLARFPNLSKLWLRDNVYLERIENVGVHPELTYLYLSSMDKLTDLGLPSPNSVLRTVAMASLPELTSVAGLEGTTGLGRLVISNCDRIPSVESIKHSNDLYYLLIRGCDLLADDPPREQPESSGATEG